MIHILTCLLIALWLLAAPGSASAQTFPLNLSWTDQSNNEDGFKIERRLDSDAWAELGRVAANVLSFTDVATVPGRMHTYRLLAFNAASDSTPSNEAAIFLAIPSTPPSGVTITASHGLEVRVTRRLTNTSKRVLVTINKDEILTVNGSICSGSICQ